MAFFNFIFNTLRSRINDAGNKRFWLPDVLLDMNGDNDSGKLLPLYVDGWDVGAITGESGSVITEAICKAYRSTYQTKGKVIADPEDPTPKLSFQKTTISGLHNLWLLADPPTESDGNGYGVTLTLQSNYYNGKDGQPVLEALVMKGRYTLLQRLSIVMKGAPNQFNSNYVEQVDGQGDMSVQIIDAFLQITLRIEITGEGPARQTAVKIKQARLLDVHHNTNPKLKIKELTIDTEFEGFKEVWEKAAEKAFGSQKASDGIFAQINYSLNQQGNLQKLSEALSSQLANAIDNLFGAVTAGCLPDSPNQQIVNPVDAYLFDRIRFALNNPDGDLYLPKTICTLANPVAEPLVYEEVGLPDQNFGGLDYKEIKLLNVVITGLSNMLASPAGLLFNTNGDLDAMIIAGGLNPPPIKQYSGKKIPAPPLACSGKLSTRPEFFDGPLVCNITINIDTGKLHFLNCFSGDDADHLALNLKYADLQADVDDIHINTSEDIINMFIDSPGIKKALLTKLNELMVQNLPAISEQITKATVAGINSRLG
jgi:hypothetical protein